MVLESLTQSTLNLIDAAYNAAVTLTQRYQHQHHQRLPDPVSLSFDREEENVQVQVKEIDQIQEKEEETSEENNEEVTSMTIHQEPRFVWKHSIHHIKIGSIWGVIRDNQEICDEGALLRVNMEYIVLGRSGSSTVKLCEIKSYTLFNIKEVISLLSNVKTTKKQKKTLTNSLSWTHTARIVPCQEPRFRGYNKLVFSSKNHKDTNMMMMCVVI
jgi:hypothetical protein